jgi:hypothetical protein
MAAVRRVRGRGWAAGGEGRACAAAVDHPGQAGAAPEEERQPAGEEDGRGGRGGDLE